MLEYMDDKNHPCFKNTQPFQVMEVKPAYTVAKVLGLLCRHFPKLPDAALQPYLDRKNRPG